MLMSDATSGKSMWMQPSKSVMRTKWHSGSGISSAKMMVGFMSLFGAYMLTYRFTESIALGLVTIFSLWLIFIAFIRLRDYTPKKMLMKDKIEERNRELVEAVREATDWHPASFQFVFAASTRGGINIYDGTVPEVLKKTRVWYNETILNNETSCLQGHSDLCKHKAPAFHRWVTSAMEDGD